MIIRVSDTVQLRVNTVFVFVGKVTAIVVIMHIEELSRHFHARHIIQASL